MDPVEPEQATLQTQLAVTKAELRLLRQQGNANALSAILISVCRSTVTAIVAYYGYKSLAVLSGLNTDANIIVRLISDGGFSVVTAWAAGTVGVLFGVAAMKLRDDTIKRFGPFVRNWEELQNPHRTSSKLSPGGKTRAEDEP
jgi:hypothetical protein